MSRSSRSGLGPVVGVTGGTALLFLELGVDMAAIEESWRAGELRTGLLEAKVWVEYFGL